MSLQWEVVLDQRHLSGSGCNWLQCGIISLIWSPGEGDSQLPPSVFGCLTGSPLMLNAVLPGHPMPVACFVKTKKMNINIIHTGSGSSRRGRQSKGCYSADFWVYLIGFFCEGPILQKDMLYQYANCCLHLICMSAGDRGTRCP